MGIFAIGDLHLDFSNQKPMNVFGEQWNKHYEKVEKDWKEKVTENDLVILPGDFCWASRLEETYNEFQFINKLPGKKILLKGNHDYWWTTVKKMNEFLDKNSFTNISFLYNNSYCFEEYIIAGTRGWAYNGNEEDEKIIKREELRLKLSIEDGVNKFGDSKDILIATHYPPISNKVNFVSIMEKYNVTKCLYGHLHGILELPLDIQIDSDIEFNLVSADYLDFKLLNIK